ncbi:TetR/AcrR family transcriptional regulator [Amycolatopsis pithecellobii]|uniref:TetR family transcriptional regulator n=1 Tax=Amycolatopsis pithecellobii TaxID=664692 RepID=A0A6N7YM99_9PSEU|nr:TetR/AcrR family transcriptional regulator [Amycolatopsis pithecellobii]MTD52988.1 TetR family transcriptional regulator [Amycolatopsis pithecellobii]
MLSSALAAVDEGGLKALTVDNVARLSETSNGSIYHRFGNRDGLVAAAIDHFLSQVEDAMAAEMEAANSVADDRAAVGRLVDLWLNLFARYHQRFRAFMVEAHEQTFHHARGRQASHAIADRLSTWLIDRFACTPAAAQTCYTILLGLGASRALWDPDEVTANPLPTGKLADEVGAMILARVTSA